MFKKPTWKHWALTGIAFLLFVGVIFTSPSFDKCVEERQTKQNQQTTKEHSLVAGRKCFFVAFHESHGILTALVTFVIAWLTVTMARANEQMATTNDKLTKIAGEQEKSARIHERAYIVCGGVYGVENPEHATPEKRARPKASYYGPPWRMAIYNFGRTPGYITKIEWGTCKESEFPDGVLVSTIVKKKLLQTKAPKYVQEVIPPVAEVYKPLEYRHVEPEREIGTVFFGRIDYDDVFGDSHHSTFALKHGAEHTDTLGESYAKDWS